MILEAKGVSKKYPRQTKMMSHFFAVKELDFTLESGKLTDETYTSLVDLVAYLSERYGLGRDQIIRHYDVTGKECPKYFVDYPEKWEAFLDDVMLIRNYWAEEAEKQKQSEAEEAAKRKAQEETAGIDELTAFLESNAASQEE